MLSNSILYNIEGINDTSGLEWFEKVPWYNKGIGGLVLRASFEYYYKHGLKYCFGIICAVKAHDQDHPDKHDVASTGGGITFPDKPTQEALEKMVRTLHFIASWLFSFEISYENWKTTYQEKLKIFFENCQ